MSELPWHQANRTPLGHLPTPLEYLPRLTRELGGPNIWVKRDDCTGLAMGGNKTRKLEYLLADASASGADTIVTFGAVQSNHARQTAAAAARSGMACHLILSQQVTSSDPCYEQGGNVLLGSLLHAQQHVIKPEQARDYTRGLLDDLRRDGASPYIIPAGGSNALGALGYARCAEEIVEQTTAAGIEPKHIVHASSSAGTQAGLIWGLSCMEKHVDVFGVNVYHQDPAHLQERISQLLQELNEMYPGAAKSSQTVHINHAYFGEGYGQPTNECLRAIHMAAQLEALLFDPVYSGKALAALIDQINLGNFDDTQDIVIIHTGGTPALNVYRDALLG